MKRILVVEDETHLAEGLRFNLEQEGYQVQVSPTGEDALKRLLEGREAFDAVVLDVMLPGQDGFAVARALREARNYIPVLMLTARSRPEDVLQGFESGTDDYLPKPFILAILIARVGSLLRRKAWSGESGQLSPNLSPEQRSADRASAETGAGEAAGDVFRFGGRVFDFPSLRLHAGNQTLQMTLMEAELLRYLIRNAGRPVSRKAILEDVWDLREDTDTRAIDNFIVRLRRYIEDDPAKPRYLITVRGLGYEFVPVPEDKPQQLPK